MTTSSRCPLCGSKHSKLLGRKDEISRTGGELHLAQCTTCNLVYLTERPEDFTAELYNYYELREHKTQKELYHPITAQRYQQLLQRFSRLTTGRKLLDIGCGEGHFVHTAVREGWAATGIDLSESAIRICQKFGVPARCQDLFDTALEPNSFDIVTLFELIEHVPDPSVFLRRAIELVRPNGLIYITTPNFNALDRRVQGLEWEPIHGEHLIYFTPSTLQKTVTQANPNVEILNLKTQNISAKTLRTLLSRKTWQPTAWSEDPHNTVVKSIEGEKMEAIQAQENHFRRQLELNPLLRWAKSACNHILDTTRLGYAMTLLARCS